MNAEKRAGLKKSILDIVKKSESGQSRIARLKREPLKAIPFFIKQIFARIRPFKVMYKTLWGDKISFYLPEGNAVYYYGFYEADLTNFFINVIKDGDVFFDIGTHVGYYTVLAARLTSPSGSVHGFEPTPRTFKTLSENVAMNRGTGDKQNVFLNNVAVMDKETELDFIDYGPKNSAFNTFKARDGKGMEFLGKPEHVKVKAISLDKYCRNNSVTPSIIKIDAEGAEHLILQSMNEILSTAKPIVTIEVGGGAEWKNNCDQSIDFLINKGFQCFETTLDGMLKHHVRKDSYLYDNLIFVHSEKLPNIQKLIV